MNVPIELFITDEDVEREHAEFGIVLFAGEWRGSAIIDLVKATQPSAINSYNYRLSTILMYLRNGADAESVIDELLQDLSISNPSAS